MRTFTLLLVLLSVGCGGSPTTSAPPSSQAGKVEEVPKKKIIHSDEPAFQEMVEAFKSNPAKAAEEYKNRILDITMTVESIEEVKKDTYKATGTTGSVFVRVTFFLVPNLDVNKPAKLLKPGNKVTFTGELSSFQPGPPRPDLTVNSGAISRVDLSAQ